MKGPGRKRALESADTDNGGKNKRIKVCHDSYGTEEGIVLVCGQGDVGQLGLGEDVMERSRMTRVDLPEPIIQICAGGMHTVCLTKSGKVWTFGCNDEGALGRDTSVEGSETTPAQVELPAPIVLVSAGDSHTAALTDDGRVYAWGNFRDSNGIMGLTKNGMEMKPLELIQEEVIVKIASGSDHLACLTNRGELLTLGCAEQGQLGRVVECFATRGGRKGLDLILNPGRVKVKGHKSRRMVQFSDMWAGQYMTFAKDKSNGDIYVWGLNNYYQLGTDDMDNKFIPQRSKTFSDSGKWTEIAGGQHHTIALNEEGQVYAIGRGDYGRLGLGEEQEKHEPTLVKALENVKCSHIGAGGCVSFAVSKEGHLYSWGMGSNGQLGTGNDDDQMEPIVIKSKQTESRKIFSIDSGGQHTTALAKNTVPNGTSH